MLKTRLLHPEILHALGSAGHGARVMIADGNYPFSTESPPGAKKVFLNLRRGLVSVGDVLEVLVDTIPIEAAMVMKSNDGSSVPAHSDYRRILPGETPFTLHKRHDFYSEVKSPATALIIATGDERRFANLLLTIGVVKNA